MDEKQQPPADPIPQSASEINPGSANVYAGKQTPEAKRAALAALLEKLMQTDPDTLIVVAATGEGRTRTFSVATFGSIPALIALAEAAGVKLHEVFEEAIQKANERAMPH